MTTRHLDARIPGLRARGILTACRDAAPAPEHDAKPEQPDDTPHPSEAK